MAEGSFALARPPGREPASIPLAPKVRGHAVLARLENLWLRLDRIAESLLPSALNPFGQLGAVANTCLIAAVVSGIGLLLGYTPSVSQAYNSLERLRTGSWPGQWVRSLHRYSSDGCILFILLHAARIVSQRRFTGARWLAWVTGILSWPRFGSLAGQGTGSSGMSARSTPPPEPLASSTSSPSLQSRCLARFSRTEASRRSCSS